MINKIRNLPKRLALAIVALPLVLTACSAGGATNATNATNASGAPASGSISGIWHQGNGNISSTALLNHATDSVKGKTLAWVPVGLGVPLTDEWTYVIQHQAQALGMKFEVRNPNWNTTTEANLVNGLIAQHPSVLVVHNPDEQLLASEIQAAQKAGIYVIQMNMVSNYKSDAYIGANWAALGSMEAHAIVNSCGTGTSGQVEIIEGAATSAASVDQLAGAVSVFKRHPNIHIVSNEDTGPLWDASKAHDFAATVLQKYPHLCAIYGFWGVMTNGAAQAVKAAGLVGKVKVFTSGGGGPINCQDLKSGLFTYFIDYNDPLQAQQVVDTANMLLQSGLKPGTVHWALYSPMQAWTTAHMGTCYTPNATLP